MFITTNTGKQEIVRKNIKGEMVEYVLNPDEGTEILDVVGLSLIKGNPNMFKEFIPETGEAIKEPVTEEVGEEVISETKEDVPPTKEQLENEELYPTEKLFQLLEGMGVNNLHPKTGRVKLVEKILAKIEELKN